MWTNLPPEQDGIYWFSMTGSIEAARPESFNRTHDGVMRFTYRASGLSLPADHFPNSIWWSEPLERPKPNQIRP